MIKPSGIFFLVFILASKICFGQEIKCSPEGNKLDYGKINVRCTKDHICRVFVDNNELYTEGLDTLENIKFWRKIMVLSPDSGIVNIKSTRERLLMISEKEWDIIRIEKGNLWLDSIRSSRGIDSTQKIVFTTGKKDFYQIEKAYVEIEQGIKIFEENNTDPFYAQAILLIESPGRLAKSNVGAYGPFQLMKSVARHQGLKVNKYVDERTNFAKSAWAAARLIRTICVPYTNTMLDKRGIAHCESDLWYRLLVLHSYHAGAGNVSKALDKINPTVGNMDIIKQLWQTTAGAFGPHSQNYSQVAIAAMFELDKLTGGIPVQ